MTDILQATRVEPTGTVNADPERASAVLDAIRTRRSIGKCSDDVPDREVIRTVLEAGTWAPNHHLSEPWRFVVLSGDARKGLGEAMGAAAMRMSATPELGEQARERARTKPLRAPYVIGLIVEPQAGEVEVEEIAAVAAAGQNMLLAAHALGLAAIWRSGEPIFTPEVRAYFRVPEGGHVLGTMYLGYPAMKAPERARRPVDEVTTWRTDIPPY